MSRDTKPLETEPAVSQESIMPVVATGGGGRWQVWLFAIGLAIGGAWLFSALSGAEEAGDTGALPVNDTASVSRITSPAPLRFPERFLEREMTEDSSAESEDSAQTPSLAPPPALAPRGPIPPFVQGNTGQPFTLPPPPTPAPLPPRVVFNANDGSANASSAAEPAVTAPSGPRVAATRLSNPTQTVPQGTVIPAVLETAIDSTRGGGVRALVQRNVSGFDGKEVLIPRGSRLYGEYQSGLQRGQNRAMVRWTRLIRPDGVTIALDSPSSDPLGRAGVKGKVDGKFWQRFGNAILQSVLDVGVGIAASEATNGVILAVPAGTQSVQITDGNQIQPTLKVAHGTSVSVFVARDLDFSSVGP